jgi:hypothetical protein
VRLTGILVVATSTGSLEDLVRGQRQQDQAHRRLQEVGAIQRPGVARGERPQGEASSAINAAMASSTALSTAEIVVTPRRASTTGPSVALLIAAARNRSPIRPTPSVASLR